MMTRESNFGAASERVPTFLCGVCELDGFSENYPSAEARQAHWTESGHGPVQEYLAANTVKRTFPGAAEMTEAEKAEAARLAPEYRAPGTKLRGRQYGTGDAPATPKQKRFASTLGIDPTGMTKAQISKAIDAAKKAAPAPAPSAVEAEVFNPPTEKQSAFVRKLLAERANNRDANLIRESLNEAREDRRLTKQVVSTAITALLAIPAGATSENAPSAPQTAPSASQTPSKTIRITNKYAGKCKACKQTVEPGEGIWQLDDQGERGVFHLDGQCPLSDLGIPVGRYALERDGVMKFYVVEPGRIFAQASDQKFPITSKANIAEIVELIGADVESAMRRYGIELEHCGLCGRSLTSDWRLQGIGPVCIEKMGW